VVTVEGAVRSPQAVPVPGASTLLTVLAQCGGRADDAGNTLTITRGSVALRELTRSGATPSPTVTVPFKRLVDVNDSMSKLEVWPGDRISVDHAGLFYVLGQVGHPGGYNLKSADEQVSVLQALALAGDITSIAKVSRTIILRKNPKTPNGRDEIALNMKDILQGRSPDRVLEADDILYVPASGSKRTIRELGTIGQVVVTGTAGAVIYSRI
jgi:polysaccharide export outer membrane protein